MTSDILTPETVDRVIAGLNIRKAERQYLGVFMSLYGQGGAGKTTLASELYKLGKTLLIDAEGGSDAIEHLFDEENLDVVDVSTYKQFERLIDALIKDQQGYVNIIVDNLSELIDLCETDKGIVGNDAHDLQRYKLVKMEIMSKVRALRNLTRNNHVNVIICCWDADEKDDRGVLKKDLSFTPALRKEFPGICTIIGHIDVLTKPEYRRVSFAPSPRSVSKFKRAKGSAAQKVPFEIVYDVDNLPLVDIINTIDGKGEWPTKKYEELAKKATASSN